MPKVSELAAMYGKPPQNSLAKSTPPRQWPPPSSAKPTPAVASPFLPASNATDSIPSWKREILERKAAQKKQREQLSDGTNATIEKDEKEVNTNGQHEADASKSTDTAVKENRFRKQDNSWCKPAVTVQKPVSSSLYKPSTTPAWENNATPTSNSVALTSPKKNFLEQSKTNTSKPNHEQPPIENGQAKLPPSNSFLLDHSKRTTSASSATESSRSSISEAEKLSESQENNFPSGGSLTSKCSQEFVTEPVPQPDEEPPPRPIAKDRPSFLHRSVSNNNQTSSGDRSERQRRPLPPVVYDQPPPEKPRKPFGARLPSLSSINDNRPPMQQRPLSNPPLSTPLDKKPSTTNDQPPMNRSESFLEKQQRRESTTSLGPPLPMRNLSNSEQGRPPSLPDRSPLPPPPPGDSGPIPPSLPNRTPPPPPRVKSSSFPEGPGGRTLPTLPGDRPPLPLARGNLSTSHEPPPLPPPNAKKGNPYPLSPTFSQRDIEVPKIETWDDEDEINAAIYDPTPDDDNSGPPPLPMKGPCIPEIDGDIDDVYTAMGEDEKPGENSSKDEKKKIDKKEKEMRKKFKLPLEGEIPVQSVGSMKSDSKKIFDKFTVHAQEEVDVIRMNDNPKGKWLIRNKKGVYGYIESDKIELSMDHIRQVMNNMSSTPKSPTATSSSAIPSNSPPIEQESLYNAADEEDDDSSIVEDVYECVG